MSKEVERLAILTGMSLQMLLYTLIDSVQHPDKVTFLQIQDIHRDAQSFLEKLNIPIKIPLPTTKDDIMTFFDSGLGELTLQVGRELGLRHSPRAETIFFFSTSVMAYATGRSRLPDSPMFDGFKRDIRHEASKLGFKAAPIEKFIRKPGVNAAQALIEQLPPEQKPKRTRSLWIRLVIGFIALLCLAAGGLVWVLNAERVISGDWSTILPIVFIVLAVAFALFTWLCPFSPVDTKESDTMPSVVK